MLMLIWIRDRLLTNVYGFYSKPQFFSLPFKWPWDIDWQLDKKKSALWLLIWVLDISECQDDHWFTYYSICFVLSDIGIYDQREIPLNLRCLMKD